MLRNSFLSMVLLRRVRTGSSIVSDVLTGRLSANDKLLLNAILRIDNLGLCLVFIAYDSALLAILDQAYVFIFLVVELLIVLHLSTFVVVHLAWLHLVDLICVVELSDLSQLNFFIVVNWASFTRLQT